MDIKKNFENHEKFYWITLQKGKKKQKTTGCTGRTVHLFPSWFVTQAV